ncbi:protein RGF1 INDUCIBLE TRANSCRIPTION FACTOR 1-like isoform X1, partial [Fagus crenata]
MAKCYVQQHILQHLRHASKCKEERFGSLLHRLSSIRRYVYNDVVNRQDLCKLFNCSGIQAPSSTTVTCVPCMTCAPHALSPLSPPRVSTKEHYVIPRATEKWEDKEDKRILRELGFNEIKKKKKRCSSWRPVVVKEWRGRKFSAMEERLEALDERNRRRKNKTYHTNKAKVVFLKQRPYHHLHQQNNSRDYRCIICNRALQNNSLYCSIACKVLAIYDNQTNEKDEDLENVTIGDTEYLAPSLSKRRLRRKGVPF